MTPVTIDYETFWTKDFSLSKISFIEYIKSPDFEAISVSIKIGDGETKTYFGEPQIKEALQAIDWERCAAIAHNGNEFDFPVLVWVHDCHPKLFIDTLCLSKPKHQSQAGGSLKKLSEFYGLAPKDSAILQATQGKRYADFDLAEMAEMARYNKVDVENTYYLFKEFTKPNTDDDADLKLAAKAARWQQKELMLSDMTARAICYPKLVCDSFILRKTLAAVEASKLANLESLLEPLGLVDTEDVRAAMASQPKFAAALIALGVDPPMKTSKTTGKETYALAKTDEGMQALLEHDDPRVQQIASVRLDVKSTLLETRLAKMIACSELMGGKMPVPLAYHSATTGRWGGRVWNPQNLPRIDPKNPKLTDALRNSLTAPPGHKVVVSDLSGIELRVNHYLWDVESTAKAYAADPQADLYKDFAAALYGITVGEVTKQQRQVAKVAQLGLGFGAGAATFQKVAKIMGGIDLDESEAKRVTNAWRTKYGDIVRGWVACQKAVAALYSGHTFSPDPRGLVVTERGGVRLPSGRVLHYPGITQSFDDKGKVQYHYGVGKNHSKLYAGLMDENLVQAIARDVISEHALAIWNTTGHWPVMQVHDELVYVITEDKAEAHLATINRIMRTPSSWLPGIVLWSEGDIADSYGQAK